MSSLAEQNPRTATSAKSIWRDLPEDKFREHLVALEKRTNAVPIQPQTFALVATNGSHRVSRIAEARLLPLEDEHRLATDLAYVAAVGEGAQSVSAVCIEECCDPPGLTFRFAAIDTINLNLQNILAEIVAVLSRSAAGAEPQNDGAYCDQLFELIVKQHYQKLLGRLRSRKWEKPKYLVRTHKKSLWRDFENLIHRAQFVYPKKNNSTRIALETETGSLARVYQAFEEIPAHSTAEFACLQDLIRDSYLFCTSAAPRDYATKLESIPNATSQISAAIKTLRQIEKIAACWRIATGMIDLTRRHTELFRNVHLSYLNPFTSVSTAIGYESWAATLHVHAEVQLAVHYDLQEADHSSSSPSPPRRSFHHPRVIGTSKHLCYLCYLFLRHHGHFVPTNTHGRLYDQWTIPDLSTYDADVVDAYRSIVQKIDADVVDLTECVGHRKGKRDAWRAEPMTSREHLLTAGLVDCRAQDGRSELQSGGEGISAGRTGSNVSDMLLP